MKYILLILFFYALYCGLLFMQQRKVVFPRHFIPDVEEPDLRGAEQLWLDLGFGRVEAWYLRPDPGQFSGPRPAVIFAHGNAELIDFFPEQLRWFPAHGIGLMLVEYPGYGRSGGEPSRRSLKKTFQRAFDVLASRPDVDGTNILAMGRSIGGAVVCDLSMARPVKGLILLSTFTSTRSFAIKHLFPPFLVLDQFDNVKALEQFEHPALIAHGSHDAIIPPEHGKLLADTAKRATFVSMDCGHNDCPSHWEQFWSEVERFLAKAGMDQIR